MSSNLQKISIIIPCFNEENTIEKIINKVLEETLNFSYLNFEIIVINDASTDATQKILEKYENKKFKFLINKKNFGKGYSLKRGINEANGDIILFQDADLEYDPSDYKKLLKPILDGNADVVFGSRFIGSGEKRVLYFWHRIGNLFLTILSNMCSNLNLTDMEIGYKVFRSNIIKKISLQENRFGIEPEITAKIAKTKCRIYEVGVSYFGRTYQEGKKITWRDGLSAIRCILYYNFFSDRVE
jgi:glycosyltransferase involved in cell wall biosynthesis